MNKKQKFQFQMLGIFSFALVLIVGLVTYALRQNISLYYTPTQISKHEAPIGKVIRVGGMVVKHSIQQSQDELDVKFVLTDYTQQVAIHYRGLLPDLFREGQGVVVKGILSSDNEIQAKEVLAKHDENYMPAEVRDSMKKQGKLS
jgi:cytochrome c-type biogenesis protein CcmE